LKGSKDVEKEELERQLEKEIEQSGYLEYQELIS